MAGLAGRATLRARAAFIVCGCLAAASWADAATIRVAAVASLQAAIDAAQPGDQILLQAGATFTGNFMLPNKGATTSFITIRSDAADSSLPPAGTRITPVFAPRLATVRSPNTMSALTAAPGAHHWRLQLLQFRANARGFGDVVALGSGGSDQSTLASVPHDLALERLLILGDPVIGQKRGVGLNSASTTIRDCYIADIKGVGFDAQAIAGWNGPGPFVVVNNYLEASGENFMLGGASPKIANMIPGQLTFTGNHVSKPASWKQGILTTPSPVAGASDSLGALPAGTYYYVVVAALPTAQDTWAWSGKSTEVAVSVPTGGRVTLTWTGDPKAKSFRVYRGTASGAQDRFFDATGGSFVDTGSVTPTGLDSGSWLGQPTRWSVKNLFELKEVDHALVDGNVFENVWQESQSGYAILFTPRNQDNTSPWIYVRDVTFSNNVIRHAGAGVQVLGYDDQVTATTSSQQTQRIRLVNNLFWDVGTPDYSGAGRFLLLAHGPSDVTVDHNTIVQGGDAVYAYGKSNGVTDTAATFVFTNNLVKHNTYGINGDGQSTGWAAINAYLPGAVISGNAFACPVGGSACSATRYPGGNIFSTEADWLAQFVDAARGDFRLTSGSRYRTAAVDGGAIGADIEALSGVTQAVIRVRPIAPAGIKVIR